MGPPDERWPCSELQDEARAPIHAVSERLTGDDREVAVLTHGCQHSDHSSAVEMWARRPCSVLLSGSASSTLCGGCCEVQAVVGTNRAPVGVLRCAWPVLLKNCARSVAETKPDVRGCVLAQAAMLAGCKTLSVGSASEAIVGRCFCAWPLRSDPARRRGGLIQRRGHHLLSKQRAASVIPP